MTWHTYVSSTVGVWKSSHNSITSKKCHVVGFVKFSRSPNYIYTLEQWCQKRCKPQAFLISSHLLGPSTSSSFSQSLSCCCSVANVKTPRLVSCVLSVPVKRKKYTHTGFRYLTCEITPRCLWCISKIASLKISVVTHRSRRWPA